MWTPPRERVERATLTRYAAWAREAGVAPPEPGYAALHAWSVANLDAFWRSVAAWFAVEFAGGDAPAVFLAQARMPGAQWCPGAELNYAAHVLRGPADHAVAIVARSELAPPRELTWGELRAQVGAAASGLRGLGVARGDRVAAILPNGPEAVVGLLACASIGAVWTSCAPEFGARSLIDRLAQVEPTVLLAVDGYGFGGRRFDRRGVLAEVEAALPGLHATVLVRALEPDGSLDARIGWEALLAAGAAAPLAPEPVPFDHPLWILYSSGTTGPPKALVQGHGGILLEHLKLLGLQCDVRAGDTFAWFTTTGWMMWNVLVSALLLDATIVTYDGSPTADGPQTLWALAAETSLTTLGVSAAYLAATMKAGVSPRDGRDLSALRAVGSTGSPLAPEAFDWAVAELPDVWLCSLSGGSDVCSAFVGGVPTEPVRRGELQGRALGAAVEAFDAAGSPVIGAVGELVLTAPLPSMPLGLWGDDAAGTAYRAAYFAHFALDPPVWRHGDWIAIGAHGGAVISGRSDATINRGGVRMGTAEIYRAVLVEPDVLDALVVDVDGWMPLFVVLREGVALDAALTAVILARVREDCSPRHVPSEVREVAAIPRTLSGKALELPVKRILGGARVEDVVAPGALADPGALEPFVALARARRARLAP